MTVALSPSSSSSLTHGFSALNDAITAWLRELDTSERTTANYHKAILRYVAYLQSESLTGSSRTDILSYKAHLIATRSPNTVNAYLTPVRRFYTWLAASMGTPNLSADIKGTKTGRGFRKDNLTISQTKQLLAGSDTQTLTGLRNAAMLALIVGTALRTVEVVRADIADFHPSGGVMVLDVQGKGRDEKDAFVIVSPAIEQKIRRYLNARGPVASDAPLFASTSRRNEGGRLTTRSVSRMAKTAMQSVGLDSPRLTAHSLRHTGITLALEGGASVQEAQAMARHASLNTTMIYAHNLDRISSAAEKKIDALLSA